MNKIKIFTDSGCDLDPDYAEKIGVTILPFAVELDGHTYWDRVSITPRQYFNVLKETKSQAFTAQVTPARLEEAFRGALDEGYETLFISMSSAMTGTFGASQIAQKTINSKKCHVFDTYTGSIGEGFLVDLAAKMVADGKNADEIVAKLQHYKEYMQTFLTVGDLGRLRASGRLSKGAAVIGAAFHITPVLKLVQGNVAVQEKLRGKSKIIKYLIGEMIRTGVDIPSQTIPICYADEEGYELCMEVKEAITKQFGNKDFFISEVGMSIGSHVGSGSIGLFFVSSEKNEIV